MPFTILMVEDDADSRRTFERIFRRFADDMKLETISNGNDLISKISEKSYNLVIIDLNLDNSIVEKYTGLNLAKIVKRNRPNLPVLLLSSVLDINLLIEAKREAKVDDAFHKMLFLADGYVWLIDYIRGKYANTSVQRDYSHAST